MINNNINMEIDLNKWCQVIITGKKITEEQALEIIRRTDSFFVGGYGGNDHDFDEQVEKICHIPNYDDNFEDYIELNKAWKEKWNTVFTSFIHNDWISSAYIHGPSGWCHPDGTIGYFYNIGKYPTIKSVCEDMDVLGKEFPFLDLEVTICEDEEPLVGEFDNTPLITLNLKNQIVSQVETKTVEELKKSVPKIEFDPSSIFMMSPKLREHAISIEQIQKWSNEVFLKNKGGN